MIPPVLLDGTQRPRRRRRLVGASGSAAAARAAPIATDDEYSLASTVETPVGHRETPSDIDVTSPTLAAGG